MLDDNNGAEIAEHSQYREQKTRVNKVSPTSMDEFTPGEFEQRRRQVTPGVQVSGRLKWK